MIRVLFDWLAARRALPCVNCNVRPRFVRSIEYPKGLAMRCPNCFTPSSFVEPSRAVARAAWDAKQVRAFAGAA